MSETRQQRRAREREEAKDARRVLGPPGRWEVRQWGPRHYEVVEWCPEGCCTPDGKPGPVA